MFHSADIVSIDDSEFFESPRKKKRESKKDNRAQQSFNPKAVKPITDTQKDVFRAYYEGQNILMHGYAGTGKSFVACYLGIKDITSKVDEKNKLIIFRSTVPSRDQGFLPGNKTEKSKPYELPYYKIFGDIFGRGDAYDVLKNRKIVEFESTSYQRGNTIDDAIVIIDEFQNMTLHEFSTVITRLGQNCRVIVSGDTSQTDLTDKTRYDSEKVRKVLGSMKEFDCFQFGFDDIVRSGLVKSYIIAKEKLAL